MKNTIYVNKKKGIGNFKPLELVEVNSRYKEGITLSKETYQQWLKLQEAARKKGYIIDIESGYRSYQYQHLILEELINKKGKEYAEKAIAKPGHSEHQTGLALDYCIYRNGKYLIEHNIELTDESIYTNSIAHLYGFILRYPKGKEEITGYKYEPWHLRYVGLTLASYLYKEKLTLDEYYDKLTIGG